MKGIVPQILCFRNFLLDEGESRLSEDGRNIALTPKAFEVLSILVRRSGHLVEKDELMQTVWPDSFVEEANLSKTVHVIRKALGDDGNGNKFIETVAKKGYRFVVDVVEVHQGSVVTGSVVEVVPVPHVDPRTLGAAPNGTRSRAFLIGLSLAVVLGLGLWLLLASRNQTGGFALPETLSGEAYNEFNQGKLLVERRYPGDYEKALGHFEKAIQLDPSFARAYAGKADANVVKFWTNSAHEHISTARTSVRKALEIDPNNSYALTIECRILTTYDWDHSAAEERCRRAVESDPNDHEAHKELAFLLNSLGREQEALASMNTAISLAPTSFNKWSRGLIHYDSRRYDEAIADFEQVEETDPSYKEVTRWLIRSYEMKKDYNASFRYFIKLTKMSSAPDSEVVMIENAFATEGWRGVQNTIVGQGGKSNMFIAGTYAQLGEKDRAIEILNEMLVRRAIHIIRIKREPTLDPIREDPRFQEMVLAANFR